MCCSKVFVRSHVQVPQGLLQHLRLFHVDGYELEDPVLCHHADHHLSLGLVVDVDERYATGTRLEHADASLVQGSKGMDRDGLDWGGTNCSLDVSQAIKLELVDLAKGVRVLPVVLHEVDVVGDGEEAGEGGGFGVP